MNRFNLNFRKYILLWALAAMVVGYLAGRYNHQRIASLKHFVAPLLFTMIFIMVFPSRLSSLMHLKTYLYPILVSFILFLLSPFLAYIVSYIIPDMFHFLRSGIVVTSTAPPDAMLSAWAGFLEGDILFSLIIQSFTFVMWILLVPFGLSLFFGSSSYFSLSMLLKNLFFLIVIPFFIAGFIKWLLRAYITREVMKRLKPTLSSVSGIIELLVVMISVGMGAEVIAKNPVIILWGFFNAAFYYLLTFIISINISRIFRLKYDIAIPLIYQNGAKNLSIAMVVAITSFKSQAALGVAACILAQFPVSALFYTLISRYNSNSAE